MRNFRNEVEDNYSACPAFTIVDAPWNDRKISGDSDPSEAESDEDSLPAAKRTRKLSDSTPEKKQQSGYKEVSTPESSDPFPTPSKKRSDFEWTGSNNEEEEVSDSDHSMRRDLGARRIQVSFARYNSRRKKSFII